MTAEVVRAVPQEEKRLTVIDSSYGMKLRGILPELALYRELLLQLAWRDVKVRYKQTVIGVVWAVAQPLLTMVVFTIVFSRFAHISSGSKPYAVLVFVGLLPWQLFSQGVTRSTVSLVGSTPLISKIYFPRIIIPLASLGAPLFDFAISLAILAVLLGAYGVSPGWGLFAFPGFVALALLISAALGLPLAALNARYRDVGYAMPFLLQLAMYLSPVVYPLSAIPRPWRTVIEINPVTGVVQGFRWGLMRDAAPNFGFLAVGIALTVIVLVWSTRYFARTQRTFADVI